jgi:hypothetical protein
MKHTTLAFAIILTAAMLFALYLGKRDLEKAVVEADGQMALMNSESRQWNKEFIRQAALPVPVEPEITAGSEAETEAVDVLLKWMPDAGEQQKTAAKTYVHDLRTRRVTWGVQATNLLNEMKEIEENEVYTEMVKIEFGRALNAEWEAFKGTVKRMNDRLETSNREWLVKQGIDAEGLVDELYGLAFAGGKMPWEE